MHWMDWVLLIAGIFLGAFEAYAILNKVPGDTISERVRVYFRIKKEHGKAGSFIFLTFWGVFAMWFAVHIGKDMNL